MKWWRVSPQLISMIHNAIDTEEWAPGSIRPPLREELGIPHDSLVLGYVGRIMPEKDLDTWLRCCGGATVSSGTVCPVGEGRDASTLSQLQRLATDLGMLSACIPRLSGAAVAGHAAFDLLSSLTPRRFAQQHLRSDGHGFTRGHHRCGRGERTGAP